MHIIDVSRANKALLQNFHDLKQFGINFLLNYSKITTKLLQIMKILQWSFISARDVDDVHLMTKIFLRMIKHIVLYPEKNFGAQEVISSSYRQNFCERGIARDRVQSRAIARDLTISVFEFYSLRKSLPEHQNLG